MHPHRYRVIERALKKAKGNQKQFIFSFLIDKARVEVSIDLDAMTASYGDTIIKVTMPDSAREALMSARWDPIQELLDNSDSIESRAGALAYV